MSKDKVVDLVKKEEVKKALCTVNIITYDPVADDVATYDNVAGYQLTGGCLVLLIHEGATHLIPTTSFDHVTIKANKE
jgi:hypothetical protein